MNERGFKTLSKFIACLALSGICAFSLSLSVNAKDAKEPKDGAKGKESAIVKSLAKPLESTKEVEATAALAEGVKFSYSDEFKKEFANAVKDGRTFIDKYLRDNPSVETGTLALVSDIDETVLDNRPFMEEKVRTTAKEVDWNGWEEWLKRAQCAPLKSSAELLKYARSKGIAVFLITGRQEHVRRETITNLLKAGINFDGLYMRKDGDKTDASVMKTEYRKKIEGMGYKILVNIGDQQSDLAGGFSLCNEKLPNKMYFIK